MNRKELQGMALRNIQDAKILLRSARYSNAYYLSGYSIELGLKACISRQISNDTIPDEQILKNIMTHEFKKLIRLSGLERELRDTLTKNSNFAANWAICSEWSPAVRYRETTGIDARYMIEALEDSSNGVMPWIQQYW